MRVIHNELVIFFDVDKTLAMPFDPEHDEMSPIAIEDPYSGHITYRQPHKPHIKLLKNYVRRGAFIVVWSKNGYQWANAVVEAFNLIGHVDLIITKPTAYVDDEPAPKWMGEHVYIPANDSFGQDEKI